MSTNASRARRALPNLADEIQVALSQNGTKYPQPSNSMWILLVQNRSPKASKILQILFKSFRNNQESVGNQNLGGIHYQNKILDAIRGKTAAGSFRRVLKI